MTIKDAFPVPDVKDALDNGPVQTREMGPSIHNPRFVHKRRVPADDTSPWTITTFRSPIVVELKTSLPVVNRSYTSIESSHAWTRKPKPK